MFAGAAREAVFSQPAVVARAVDFVPLALKAGLAASPPSGPEGRLYAELGRTAPAPQGICVANARGKPLAWALTFDDDAAVLAFLARAEARFREAPEAEAVTTERWMRFPSRRLPDVSDGGQPLAPAPGHAPGEACPARPRPVRGALAARLVGRALDAQGRPVADTRRQESYVEDRVSLPPEAQAALARALAAGGRVAVPDALARPLIGAAYLGPLDVSSLRNGGLELSLWAERQGDLVRLGGESRAEGRAEVFEHANALTWDGLAALQGERVTALVLVARGEERLVWRGAPEGAAEVTALPGGHRVELTCGVRYGVVAEPVPDEEACDAPPDSPELALQRKLERLQGAVLALQADGRDPSPIGRLMQGLEPLLQAGRLDEAHALVDRALAEAAAPPGDEALRDKARRLVAGIERLERAGKDTTELRRLLDQVQARLAEAEALLDEAERGPR